MLLVPLFFFHFSPFLLLTGLVDQPSGCPPCPPDDFGDDHLRPQFFTLLQDAGVLPSPTRENIADMNLFSGCWGTVKAACCAGLMPNLVRIDFGRSRGERTGKMYTKEHGAIKAHPSSVNDKERRWYGTFGPDVHHFDCFELNFRRPAEAQAAAFSCLRSKWADIVLI